MDFLVSTDRPGAKVSGFRPAAPPDGRGAGWWAGMDSNHRRQNRRVYSPFPLATRAPTLKGGTLAEQCGGSEWASPEGDGAHRLGSEHPLHQDNVEPLAKFSADFPFGPHRSETQGLVKSDRGIVAANDPGHNGMESAGCADVEKFA